MLGLERLGEEVRPVVDGLDEGDGDALLLDELSTTSQMKKWRRWMCFVLVCNSEPGL